MAKLASMLCDQGVVVETPDEALKPQALACLHACRSSIFDVLSFLNLSDRKLEHGIDIHSQ